MRKLKSTDCLYMGKYYRVKCSPDSDIYRASLCTYCSMRKVANYHRCLFKGLGMILIPPRPPKHKCQDPIKLLGCHPGVSRDLEIQEVTERDYITHQLQKHL